MKITIGSMALCITMATAGFTQDSVKLKKPSRFEWSFNGGFGFFLPININQSLANRGNTFSTNFQCNYKDHSFARVYFDQTNVSYKTNVPVNGLTTEIDGKLTANFIGLDIGYTFLNRKVSPYLFIGTNLATLDMPVIEPNLTQNNIKYRTDRGNYLGLRAGAGVEFEFSPTFILYTDFQYNNIPYKTNLNSSRIQGVNIQIGFKSPFAPEEKRKKKRKI